jgi:3-methyladenine DNA glycosylase AlkD
MAGISAETIRSELAARVNPEYRDGCRAFFKEPVDPWGVRSADLQAVESIVYRSIKAQSYEARYLLFEELWRSGKLEEGAMVCHIARRFQREFGARELKRFEHWIEEYVHNWAHCDGVASWLLAGCIANDPALRQKLIPWTKSRNHWKRRASAVSFLQEAKKGRSVDFIFDISKRLESDPDIMVQKGVGWLLKETYPKRQEETVEFLRLNRFPRLVVRYAAEKMSTADRVELGLLSRAARRPKSKRSALV